MDNLQLNPPRTFAGDIANPPQALTPLCLKRQWVCWGWRLDGRNKWTKPPFCASNPKDYAKSDDPNTWSDRREAVSAVLAGKAHGIGFCLTNTPIAAIDLDKCRDPVTGTIDRWAQDIIDAAPEAYCEVTVSGTGLRIIGTGDGTEVHRAYNLDTKTGARLEIFRRATRYITVSGVQIGDCATLSNINKLIDRLVEQHDGPRRRLVNGDQSHASGDIDDLIQHGAPKGQRSEAFSRVIWSLAGRGHGLDEIKAKLAAHPNGIASKYAKRLEREIERCFRKWQMHNPKPVDGAPEWPDLKVDKKPKKTYRNARLAIQSLGIICSYDRFHDRMLVGGEPINQWAGELSDAANFILRQMIIERFDFDAGKDNIADATSEQCLENRFDPIVDYLDGLDWDGIPRLEKWLVTYLGAEDTPLNCAIGRLTLMAGVRRARKPGCKFDQVLVLEGPEGTMKSTAIVTLAGDDNFSDQTILTASDKEQQELVRGVWIFEIADLAGMKRSEVEKVKAFASRTHDRARPAYGRHRIDAPRRCIFIGTTNDDEYLKSETGNRRIWPIKTGTIDIAALRRDRNQLWAEAAAVEEQGGPLVLPKELWAEAAVAQDERRQHDPWDDILASVPGHHFVNEETGMDEERIRSDELLKNHLEISPGRTQNADTLRLKRVMRRLGWSGPKKLRFPEGSKRGYFRKLGKIQK